MKATFASFARLKALKHNGDTICGQSSNPCRRVRVGSFQTVKFCRALQQVRASAFRPTDCLLCNAWGSNLGTVEFLGITLPVVWSAVLVHRLRLYFHKKLCTNLLRDETILQSGSMPEQEHFPWSNTLCRKSHL